MLNKKILIAGASGRIGGLLAKAWQNLYSLILVDRVIPAYNFDHATFIHGDLSDAGFTNSIVLNEVHTVINLTLHGNFPSDWDVIADNFSIQRMILQTAAKKKIPRVIFASTVLADIYPWKPYVASKKWGEVVSMQYARHTDLSVLCLRLGGIADYSDPRIELGKFELRHILTTADTVNLFTAALESPISIKYGVFYGISANKYPRFDIAETTRVLGYIPQDDAYQIAVKKLLNPTWLLQKTKRGINRLWKRINKNGNN